VTEKSDILPLGIYVPETRFGTWFTGTGVWTTHVLDRAIKDLQGLIKNRRPSYPVIVDVGCGWGHSFRFLRDCFTPELIIGIDINPEMLRASATEAVKQRIDVTLFQSTSCHLALADQSVDMVFCHQTFHHLVDQENAVCEFHRVLKPGGLLLFAESTKAYIHSWLIRALFRHPMEVQKSAPEYVKLIEDAGFQIFPESISLPYLWWSRVDLGIMENWFGRKPPTVRDETLLNMVAVRP
jgi:ubiquinone/menaquinone biosynthesis C-methylase UbiE